MGNATGAAISGHQLEVRFEDGTTIFKDLRLNIARGEMVAMVGPSGCGKTTLLRTIAGLQTLSAGTLQFDPPLQNRLGMLGYVFQKSALLPWCSAWRNVSMPLELIDRRHAPPRSERRALAKQWLSAVGLAESDFEKQPDQLSGGMQMRVSIARALITDPSVLLLDEPFSALDDMLRARLGVLLQQLWLQQKRTIVWVTHNIQEAVLNCQRVLVMNRGEFLGEVKINLPYPREPSAAGDPTLLSCIEQVTTMLQGCEVE